MNIKPTTIKRQNRPMPPVGMLAGLLTASCVTLVCICFNVAPFDILIRASISATAMGGIVSFGATVVQLANARNRGKR